MAFSFKYLKILFIFYEIKKFVRLQPELACTVLESEFERTNSVWYSRNCNSQNHFRLLATRMGIPVTVTVMPVYSSSGPSPSTKQSQIIILVRSVMSKFAQKDLFHEIQQ